MTAIRIKCPDSPPEVYLAHPPKAQLSGSRANLRWPSEEEEEGGGKEITVGGRLFPRVLTLTPWQKRTLVK